MEEAIKWLEYSKENYEGLGCGAPRIALDMAISALREQKSPCAACGYGGKHLDAPPCTTCPAHPKLESKLKVLESTEQSEAVTKCNDLYDEVGGEVLNRPESDTVKVVDSDHFARNLHDVASGSCKNCTNHADRSNCCKKGNSWISVKDRRPEYKTRVLFVDVRGLVFSRDR